MKAFEITPADVEDRKGLEVLSLPCGCTIIADKGYISDKLKEESQEQGKNFLALKRKNAFFTTYGIIQCRSGEGKKLQGIMCKIVGRYACRLITLTASNL